MLPIVIRIETWTEWWALVSWGVLGMFVADFLGWAVRRAIRKLWKLDQ